MADKTRIVRRVDPCNCGCCGNDPWHKGHYRRVLSDVREVKGSARSYGESFGLLFDRLALASAPWSDEPVVVARWVPREGGPYVGWIFVKDVVVEGS